MSLGRLRGLGAVVGSSGCFLIKFEVEVKLSFPQGLKSGAAGFSCTGAVCVIVRCISNFQCPNVTLYKTYSCLSVGSKYFYLRPRRGIVYLGELLLVIVCYVLVCLPTHGSANVHVISKQRTWLP